MKLFLLSASFIIFLSFSCTQEIPFSDLNISPEDIPVKLVVNGFISNEKDLCQIKIVKPSPISDYLQVTNIDNAQVRIQVSIQEFEFHYDEATETYISNDSIQGIAGKTYALEINYDNHLYLAKDLMPDPPNDLFNIPFSYVEPNSKNGPFGYLEVPIHSFGYSQTNIWAFIEGYLRDPIPKRDLNFLFRMQIYTHKGNYIQGMFPPLNVWVSTVGQAIGTDSIEIIKGEISLKYEKYLVDKFNETDWQGDMFSTIPGNVSTNLSEGATGYFYAINVSRKRFVLQDFVK
jgi:hypothetical protein